MTQIRGKGWTVFGTISNALIDNGYFEIHTSTNSECFMTYMRNLKAKIKPECEHKRLVMCLDNHKAHKGFYQLELLNTFCEPFFLPPYSCELNAQETCWSVLKQRCKKQFTRIQLELKSSRELCIDIVKKEIEKIEPQVRSNLMRSHYEYIQELFDQVMKEYEEP